MMMNDDELFLWHGWPNEEYKNYLIARGYHPGLAGKQFQKVEMTSRNNARKKILKEKRWVSLSL